MANPTATLILLSLALPLPMAGRSLHAAVLRVPDDYATIQEALDAAQPGDAVEVADGVYSEKIFFPASGQLGSPIVLRPAPGALPVLDGSGVAGSDMVSISNKSHLRLEGFEIRNNLGVSDGSGIRIVGVGTDLEILDNRIHEIRGTDAMGITVYGTEPQPISGLVIARNEIYDCDPAQSEALTLNGNIDGFAIVGNTVRDVNNIGIDMIGGETDIQPDPSLVARNGTVRGNTVVHANANYGGGYAGGIYVDGGRDIVIENNFITLSDLGIEVGAENAGVVTSGIVVRNNVVFRNERAGIVFGGFEAAAGRVAESEFRGNTLFQNNTVGNSGQGTYFIGGGVAELWIQWAETSLVENNLIVAGDENVFVGSYDAGSSVDNALDFNLYWSANPAAGEFTYNGASFQGFTEWQTGSGQDPSSSAEDPLLSDPGAADFHLLAASPAIDTGDPGYHPDPAETDLDGSPRLVGPAVDRGADESGPLTLFADGFESGDTSAWSLTAPGPPQR